MNMHESACQLWEKTLASQHSLSVQRIQEVPVYDFGLSTVCGGLEAGRALAELTLAGLAQVQILHQGPQLTVHTYSDQPVRSCLGSQYAGWQITTEDYFAMGSGPIRSHLNREEMIQRWQLHEPAQKTILILEADRLPTPAAMDLILAKAGLSSEQLSVLLAPCNSLAGSIQVVSRSLETALHKMHEMGFPLDVVRAGSGVAPLPPIGKNSLQSIGWTNDAILYAAEVTVWVECLDELILKHGPNIPSNSSKDYGVRFEELFKRYGDFYKIDPALFSPARIMINNLQTGRSFCFGQVITELGHFSKWWD